jgi:hypothetical protein
METNPYAPPVASLEVPAGGVRPPVRVGFGPRFGAALIDAVVVWVIGILISDYVLSLFPEHLEQIVAGTEVKMDSKVAEQMVIVMSYVRPIAIWSVGATGVRNVLQRARGVVRTGAGQAAARAPHR